MSHLPVAMAPCVRDRFGRTLRYLRLGITDRCNLSCLYCNPGGRCVTFAPEPLSWADLAWIVEVAAGDLGIEALRITGGEPTIRPGLADWIRTMRSRLPAIRDVSMTTNGLLLARLAVPLAQAGINRISLSLDSLRPTTFRAITRGGDLKAVLAGFNAAVPVFGLVKINAVILRQSNLEELADFVAFSNQHRVEVRFIEAMPLGDDKGQWRAAFVPVSEIRQRIQAHGYELVADGPSVGYGPSTSWRVVGTQARLGFISQMSCTQCATCNKLRVTADATLRPCLLAPDEVPLADIVRRRDADALADALSVAFLTREAQYSLRGATTSPLGRSMQCIGG